MDNLRLPAEFKFKNQILAFISMCLFSFGFLAFTLIAIRHGIGLGWGLFFTFLAMFLLLLTGITIAGQSDIIIDDQGISRRLFWITWRSIRWDNIQVIKTFHVVAQGFRPKSVRAFAIYPSVKLPGKLTLPGSGSIAFTEGFENIGQLIELINYYATKYEIKIEIQANGIKTITNFI